MACLISRQGDKNHNPRKGTETILSKGGKHLDKLSKIRTIIPVRGRKQLIISANTYVLAWIRTIIPVRGRKLVHGLGGMTQGLNLIRTIIPVRGRKRPLFYRGLFPYKRRDKNHNPRKGTETLSSA